jgi:hypothetical protein
MYPTQRSPRIMDNRILSTSPSLEKNIYEEIDMARECYNLPSFFSGSASTLVLDTPLNRVSWFHPEAKGMLK